MSAIDRARLIILYSGIRLLESGATEVDFLIVKKECLVEVADLFKYLVADDGKRSRYPIHCAGLQRIGPGAIKGAA